MKSILHYLALLNLLDGIFTFYGLQNGHINEANPIMHVLYEFSPLFFLLLKIFLTALLYVILYHLTLITSVWIKRLSLFASICYTYIFLLHSYWIVQII
ncbi:DUF5658 family protein [Bacillus sp. PS06]|uniref:DUF5658 family protein n=1 Tax=Bacillus sp. PS06 TaxID=2764176 RepID=UPI00177D416A|nr:DUF5658 family protein [Bacillus sp. PS06]MBD8071324.1 hypothetical protein [Bacillus sp. PS06]